MSDVKRSFVAIAFLVERAQECLNKCIAPVYFEFRSDLRSSHSLLSLS